MSDNDLNLSLGFVTDDASIAKAKRAIEETRIAMLKIGDAAKAADEGKESLARAAKAYDTIDSAATQAADAAQLAAKEMASADIDALQRSVQAYQDIESSARAAATAAASVNNASGGGGGGGVRSGRGGDVFDSTGAAGDIASATGGIRGALEVLGVASDSAAGRVLELTEALGDAGEYVPLLVRTVGDLASKGGPATTAAFGALSSRIGDTAAKATIAGASIGAAGLALAGLSIAVQKLQQDAAAAQKGISEAFSARDKVNTFRDSGGTEAQARAKIAQIQTELETARGEFALAERTYAQAYAEVEAANGAIKARFGLATGYFSEFQKRIEETSKRVQDLTAEYDTYNNSLGAGKFAKDVEMVGDAFKEQSRAAEDAARTIEQSSGRQLDYTAMAYEADEAMLATHSANETAIKAAGYNQQIGLAAAANQAIANGYRELNMSGASNSFKPGSFGGLRPMNVPYVSRDSNSSSSQTITNNNRPVININAVSNANEMEHIVLNSLERVGLLGK